MYEQKIPHKMTTPSSAPSTLRIALIQLLSGTEKHANLTRAGKAVDRAAALGAELISLPECFNSEYATDKFPENAEPIPATIAALDAQSSPSTAALSDAAKRNKVFLVGGSIPERDVTSGKVYNTSLAFGPDGSILARHRKMHLFDIDIPGRMTFKESETLSGGDSVTTFDTPYGKVGLGICYDMRFPLLSMLLRQSGCNILIFPGAFNTVTGPAHWELLIRARALDTQCFVAACSPARNPASKYQAWGHSTIVSPWGEVVATTDETEQTIFADLNLNRVSEVRAQIPVSQQVRTDLYELRLK